MTFGDILGLLRLSPETSVIVVVLMAGLALWRWQSGRDARGDEARLTGQAVSAAEMADLRKRIEILSGRVRLMATKDDLQRVENDLLALKSDVRANWTELKGALSSVEKQLEGQRQILMRLDQYLLEREK